MAPIRILLVAFVSLAIANIARAQPKNPNGWSEPVDGIACRLKMKQEYVVSQTVSAVIEIKNTSDRKRYLIPHLDPLAADHLAVEISGPRGRLTQVGLSKGFGSGTSSYKPIEPGEIIRHEVVDLRDHFGDLLPGKHTALFRFRSPKPPEKSLVLGKLDDGKIFRAFREFSADVKANAWVNEATSNTVAFDIEFLWRDDLIVHEWGVFTVFNDVKFANINRKQEWGSLPSFFYRQFPTERLRWMPSGWDKPIIYFYAKRTPMKVNVKVNFGDGAPVAWWPAAVWPVEDPFRRPKPEQPFHSLVWHAWLGDEVPSPLHGGALTKVDDFQFLPIDCWLQHARLRDATRLTVIGTMEGKGIPGRMSRAKDRLETERFIYYDGLVPAPSYLRCEKVEAKSVRMRNSGAFDIGPLFIVDRREKDHVGFAFVDGKKQRFKAGTSADIAFRRVDKADWADVGMKQVREALLGAGLFEPEVDSILKLWDKQFLHSTGVTAFHILPQSEYDRMLPLDILPAPRMKPTRVGIALHPHIEIEPDLTANATQLIRQLGSSVFEKRATAEVALQAIGPLAIPLLRAELKKAHPLETARRIQSLLERVDSADWLQTPK